MWGNSECEAAINQFGNLTDIPVAFYDMTGVELAGIGVGMGKDLCLCFAVDTTQDIAVNICWLFNGIGQLMVQTDANLWNHPVGSHRPGASKHIPRCEDIDVTEVEASWSATAAQPSFSRNIQTVNIGPSTAMQTLTPTLVNLTVSSSAVVTGSDGSLTTVYRTYTTTAAIINYESGRDKSADLGNRIALGVGLGLGIPTLVMAVIGTYYMARAYKNNQRERQAPPPI